MPRQLRAVRLLVRPAIPPTGPSSTPDVRPPGLPLGAPGQRRPLERALRASYLQSICACGVYGGPQRARGSVPHSKLLPTTFEDFTAFKCARSGVSVGMAGDLRFENFRVADNGRAGFESSSRTIWLGAHRGRARGSACPPQQSRRSGPLASGPAAGPTGGRAPWACGCPKVKTSFGVDRSCRLRPRGAAFATCNHCDFPNTKDNDAKTGHLEAIRSTTPASPTSCDGTSPTKACCATSTAA